MKLRYTIFRALIDIGILALGLMLIYLNQIVIGDWASWLSTDAVGVLIIVFAAYIATIAFIEVLLVYMRQDTWFAKIVKSLVSILLIVTVFPAVLFGLLWLFGYVIQGDVVPVLLVITTVRTIVRIWLGRVFERRSA